MYARHYECSQSPSLSLTHTHTHTHTLSLAASSSQHIFRKVLPDNILCRDSAMQPVCVNSFVLVFCISPLLASLVITWATAKQDPADLQAFSAECWHKGLPHGGENEREKKRERHISSANPMTEPRQVMLPGSWVSSSKSRLGHCVFKSVQQEVYPVLHNMITGSEIQQYCSQTCHDVICIIRSGVCVHLYILTRYVPSALNDFVPPPISPKHVSISEPVFHNSEPNVKHSTLQGNPKLMNFGDTETLWWNI